MAEFSSSMVIHACSIQQLRRDGKLPVCRFPTQRFPWISGDSNPKSKFSIGSFNLGGGGQIRIQFWISHLLPQPIYFGAYPLFGKNFFLQVQCIGVRVETNEMLHVAMIHSQHIHNERKSLLHRSHVVLPSHMLYQKEVDSPHHLTIGEGVINQLWVGGHQPTMAWESSTN